MTRRGSNPYTKSLPTVNSRRLFLGYISVLRRSVSAVFCILLLSSFAASAETPSKITLETSETLFTFFAGLNACGYDEGLEQSGPLRAQIRNDLAQAIAASPAAAEAKTHLCTFYADHQMPDTSQTVAQYVSLALNTTEPPKFETTIRESDLPPDASEVLGFLPVVQRFYDAAGLHSLWAKYRPAYENLIEQLHDPVAGMIQNVDVYLRMPISGYVARRFAVYVEPQIAPGEVNARNYAADYFMVMAPVHGTVPMDELRHTYLHYIIDPLMMKHSNSVMRLRPLLNSVSTAPLDADFKSDIGLLVTESLIRAIEARTLQPRLPASGDRKQAQQGLEARRAQAATVSMQQGFILTQYFYDALAAFEKSEEGFQDAFGNMLYYVSLPREQKRAREVKFAAEAAPEVVRSASLKNAQGLDRAEEQLVSGDIQGAKQTAQESLEKPGTDPSRAYFILARAATLSGDMTNARSNFEKALQGRDPRVLAWSHIYLGRIYDLQENREAAIMHYNAALNAGDASQDTKIAAQKGLQKPYEPQVKREHPQ